MPYLPIIFLCLFFFPAYTQERLSLETAGQQAQYYLEELQARYRDGDYELHKAYSDSLLDITRKYGFNDLEVMAIVNQAVYYNHVNDYEKALERYYLALEQSASISSRDVARTVILVNIGNTYNNIGAHDKAISTMDTVLLRSRRYPVPPHTEISAYNGLATAYSQLDDEKTAMDYLLKVKEKGEQLKDTAIMVTALNNLSSSYLELQQYDRALETASSSLQLLQDRETRGKTLALINKGLAYLRQGEAGEALGYLKRSVALAARQKSRELQMESHKYLAECYEALGQLEDSYREQKHYTRLVGEKMDERTGALNLDHEKEKTEREENLALAHREKEVLKERQQWFIAVIAIVLSVLTVLLVSVYLKRKKLEKRHTHLLKNLLDITEENNTLKSGIQQVAESSGPGGATLQDTENETEPQYKNSSLTPGDRRKLMERITEFMETDKPYLDLDLDHALLASKLGISNNHLSEVLNRCFKQNFYNFINLYRVNEACNLMQSEDHKDAKLISIAYDSGFKSKSSFNRVFKLHTGYTPSAYRKRYGEA
ncbi:AraC family transcriptional regulator [Sinomicrobium soli]|uniref:AraC family transcriptional regulator n=1 Tax=Sinomicrobium sp. N-1-3-6 TaxID=2219864 RepID=UPI000DCC8E16|nr:AraC family transcriptional regulator [Sinomicrobium sp. N-1-3-6]RAV28416.1 hypothetical protein DN748_13610 [Sinomicrobium sp. N-1-3-6]